MACCGGPAGHTRSKSALVVDRPATLDGERQQHSRRQPSDSLVSAHLQWAEHSYFDFQPATRPCPWWATVWQDNW